MAVRPESVFWELVSFAEITTFADAKAQEPSWTKRRSMCDVLYASGFSSSNGPAFMHYYQLISLSPWVGKVCSLSLHSSSLHIILQQTFKFTINPQETFFFPISRPLCLAAAYSASVQSFTQVSNSFSSVPRLNLKLLQEMAKISLEK